MTASSRLIVNGLKDFPGHKQKLAFARKNKKKQSEQNQLIK